MKSGDSYSLTYTNPSAEVMRLVCALKLLRGDELFCTSYVFDVKVSRGG